MSDDSQLSFPGLAPEPPQKKLDRLFFAIFPDAEAAARIAETAARLREAHGFKGQPLQTERFHITLSHIGDFAGLPERIVAQAREAASGLDAAPFDVTFDYVMSFKNRADNCPYVLRGGDGLADLIAFRERLAVAMTHAGLGRRVVMQFTPHVTLLYDARLVDETPVGPITWTARELVLVHSLLGQGRHVPLGRWPLDGETP